MCNKFASYHVGVLGEGGLMQKEGQGCGDGQCADPERRVLASVSVS